MHSIRYVFSAYFLSHARLHLYICFSRNWFRLAEINFGWKSISAATYPYFLIIALQIKDFQFQQKKLDFRNLENLNLGLHETSYRVTRKKKKKIARKSMRSSSCFSAETTFRECVYSENYFSRTPFSVKKLYWKWKLFHKKPKNL